MTNGDVSFTLDDPIKELLTENNAALGADQVVKKVQQAAGTIKNCLTPVEYREQAMVA